MPMPPLDLFDGKITEPQAGLLRKPTLQQKTLLADNACHHAQNVANWQCGDCNGNIARFDLLFDDYQGKVGQYLQICYDNSFLEDFLHSQVEILSPRVGGELQKPKVPHVIYQQYNPKNTAELREYTLFCIARGQ